MRPINLVYVVACT
ncbi:hypothetical protein F383_01227 [Gossypium arboreum]|nr:hypothetical protein F383_01227 [Gossypium arboreum]